MPLASRHPRRHAVQAQLPGRRRVSHQDRRPCSGPVHQHGRECEHARDHDRWPHRVPQTIGGPADLALADRKEADRHARRSWIASRRFPCRSKPGCTTSSWRSSTVAHVESDENLAETSTASARLASAPGPLIAWRVFANGIEVAGPFNPTGVSKTASRALIFVCDPKTQEQRLPARGRSRRIWRDAPSAGP